MGLWDWITRPSDKKQLELDFIKEKNEIKLEAERRKHDIDLGIREKKSELDKIMLEYKIKDQEARIEEEFGDIIENQDDENSSEVQLLKMFTPAIAGMMNKSQPTQDQPLGSAIPINPISEKPSGLTFTDEEINDIYKALPQVYKTLAKTMDTDQIKKFITGKYPNIDPECLNRMVLRVKQ